MKNKKIKVIFADWDGVCNRFDVNYQTPLIQKGDYLTQADPELVFRLNKLVDDTGCELVLSSSWRHDPAWREVMKASGVVKKFLDRTPTKIPEGWKTIGNGPCRGDYIWLWLFEDKNHPEVEDYVILDDYYDFLPDQASHVYLTREAIGLTEEIAKKITERFGVDK